MKYVSLDIETMGLGLENDIVELGMVVEDTTKKKTVEELPSLRILFRHNLLMGQPYAMGMHADSGILKELQQYKYEGDGWVQNIQGDNRVLYQKDTNTYFIQGEPDKRNLISWDNNLGDRETLYNLGWEVAYDWLSDHYSHDMHYPIRVAGKNAGGFDLPHLQAKGFTNHIPVDFRVLDVGVLFMEEHIKNGGYWLPSLKKCLEYAGIEKEIAHNAVEDSQDVISCIRYKLG